MYKQEEIKPYGEQGDKGELVEKMFDNIAPTYDVLNHRLSWDIDKRWRRKAIGQLVQFRPQEMLDIATGTGDFAILAAQMLNPSHLIGADISEGMMDIGRKKVEKAELGGVVSQGLFHSGLQVAQVEPADPVARVVDDGRETLPGALRGGQGCVVDADVVGVPVAAVGVVGDHQVGVHRPDPGGDIRHDVVEVCRAQRIRFRVLRGPCEAFADPAHPRVAVAAPRTGGRSRASRARDQCSITA